MVPGTLGHRESSGGGQRRGATGEAGLVPRRHAGKLGALQTPRRSVHILEQHYLTKLRRRTLQELLLVVNQSRERLVMFACVSLRQEKREREKQEGGCPN